MVHWWSISAAPSHKSSQIFSGLRVGHFLFCATCENWQVLENKKLLTCSVCEISLCDTSSFDKISLSRRRYETGLMLHSERLTPWTSKTEQQVKARGRDPLTQSSSSSYHGGCWMLPAAGWTVCSSPTSLFFPSLFPSSLPRPPPPLCARAQTEQHQHCCPHLLCPPALCSMFTHWRVRLSRLGPHQTQTHSFSHCPSFFHSCQQNSTAAHFFFFSCFSCFWHKTLEFLSLPLSLSRRLLLSSSCQVDISFISQEVFDRPFYEEMYPPAAPIATAQLQYIFPSRTDSHRRFNFHPFFSLHHSGPFHFTFLFLFLFCCFLLFLIKISSNVWSSTWKRDSLYFVSSLW